MANLQEKIYSCEYLDGIFSYSIVENLTQFAKNHSLDFRGLQSAFYRGKKYNRVIFYTSKDGRFFLYRIPK